MKDYLQVPFHVDLRSQCVHEYIHMGVEIAVQEHGLGF